MAFTQISPFSLQENVFSLIDQDWMLITAGPYNESNSMTASWGGFGILWHKPICFIFIRPTRYTFEFMDKFNNFTLCFFEEKHRNVLQVCGTMSGRNTDKIKLAGLTPMLLEPADVGFEEARLILQCNKIYYEDLSPARFLDPHIETNYPKKDYHRMFIGEIHKVHINH